MFDATGCQRKSWFGGGHEIKMTFHGSLSIRQWNKLLSHGCFPRMRKATYPTKMLRRTLKCACFVANPIFCRTFLQCHNTKAQLLKFETVKMSTQDAWNNIAKFHKSFLYHRRDTGTRVSNNSWSARSSPEVLKLLLRSEWITYIL
jgi:hypothetical protein